MKAFLMYKDRDFDMQIGLPPNADDLRKDLALDELFQAMANGDKLLFDVAHTAILSSVRNDLLTIRYRQEILQDCLEKTSVVRRLYALAGEALEREKKKVWGSFLDHPSSRLSSARQALEIFVGVLREIRAIADEHAHEFQSPGFTRLFRMLRRELSDTYFSCVQEHLREVNFRDGVLTSAELGNGNKGESYVLRKPAAPKGGWIRRLLSRPPPSYTLQIHPRDQAGARALSELRDRATLPIANALGRATTHIRSFFLMLRHELAFYLGCMNLHEQLVKRGVAMCVARPEPLGRQRLSFEGIYDVSLALTTRQRVVGNDANANGRQLMIITGANGGGKTTFLRSVGLAQLMMQAGMFVPAASFHASLCDGLFTHFKREEDPSMKSGKLDEELSRMSGIVAQVTRNSILLFNESFAATNEREGSEIASHIVRALLEHKVRVMFVTHLFEFAHRYYREKTVAVKFLRAERLADGRRPFKLVEAPPLETSYGADLYNSLFDEKQATAIEHRVEGLADSVASRRPARSTGVRTPAGPLSR